MLQSLWRRFVAAGNRLPAEQCLARYFKNEGLHAELASHLVRRADPGSALERNFYAAHSYFV